MYQAVPETNANPWSFISELLKYYKEFLETDFRSRFKPKRRILLTREEGLNGLALTKYPGLNDLALELLSTKFKVPKLEQVDEGEFSIYPTDKAIEGIDVLVEKFGIINEDELLNAVLDNFEEYIKKEKLTDIDNSLYSRAELRSLLKGLPSKKYASIIKKYKLFDFYRDINLLMQTKKLTDKTDFYLYFYDIKFDGELYPLLYIPLTIEVPALPSDTKRHFDLKFEDSPILYINEKSLQYISEKLSDSQRYKLKIDLPKRQFYWNEVDDIIGTFNDIFTKVSNRFEIPHFSLGNTKVNLENDDIKLSSTCYLTVFDKSDEAIVNDYEALMLLLEEDSSVARELFDGLIKGFLLENPEVVTLKVDEDFEQLDPTQKLTYKSPISLNGEQIKILEALRRSDVRNVIVEGPPGTGKSHTISAIIYDALLNEKTVLVVSDKKEALDVVEEKITDLLEKIKVDDSFVQNPILRLGQSDNNFNKIFQTQNFEKIKDRFNAHKFNYSKTQDQINTTIQQMQGEISTEIVANKDFYNHILELIQKSSDFESDHLLRWQEIVDLDELSENKNYELLEDLYEAIKDFKNSSINFSIVNSQWILKHNDLDSINHLTVIVKALTDVIKLIENVTEKDKFKYTFSSLLDDTDIELNEVEVLIKKMQALYTAFSENERLFNIKKLVDLLSLENISVLKSELQKVYESFHKANLLYKHHVSQHGNIMLVELSTHNLHLLEEYLIEVSSIKSFLWTLTKKSQINQANQKLQFAFPASNTSKAHTNVPQLNSEFLLGKEIINMNEEVSKNTLLKSSLLELKYFNYYFSNGETDEIENTIIEILNQVSEIETLIEKTDALIAYKKLLPSSTLLTLEALIMIFNSLQLTLLVDTIEDELISMELSPVEISAIQNPNIVEFLDLAIIQNQLRRFENISEISKYLHDESEIIETISDISEDIPKTLTKLELNLNDVTSFKNNKLNEIDDLNLKNFINYLKDLDTVNNFFSTFGPSNYNLNRKILQNRLISNMTYILDKKVVEFRTEHQNDATQIRNIIKSKGQIPKKFLKSLIEAFPCLIVNIRELGEYLPLEPQLFDIVIIDEASQVSIAQAFPALLRAKKVVVLGDTKQFSNVKTSTASIPLNNEAFSKVKETYSTNLKAIDADTRDAIKDNIYRFDIKNSILSFMQSVSNYQTMLLKHFRCYLEIIDYSNQTFYGGRLQVMKLRGVNIQDVLSFVIVEDSEDVKVQKGAAAKIIDNANAKEAEFIVQDLERLAASQCLLSVGVITPFRNQQQYIYEEIKKSPFFNYIEDKMKLKVMTFDSCQGEERDIVYYSMVESISNSARLSSIFAKAMSTDDEDGKLREQRLNVGFSRAKDKAIFVLSKPYQDFTGEIGNAIRHFHNQLEEGLKLPNGDQTESEGEKLLLNLVQQTKFYKENKDSINIQAQFPIGKYLKSINNRIDIPDYRADFLLTFNKNDEKPIDIILEYDGFEFHFQPNENINKYNYDEYYVSQDIERQKALETYGYEFVRMNKFLLREDPIGTLDKYFELIVKKKY